nr:PREDICTED: anillin isoform X3 [Paralichthys olivaceus]
MDPFTEKLLERTRARRENLQKKMADRPNAANRPIVKRPREPLADSNSVISEPVTDKAPQASSKPSPSKRLCSGEYVQPAAGEENQEPTMMRPVAQMVSDPPTDKKPPVMPGCRQSSSLERTATRPDVQSQPGQLKTVQPEPEKMAVTTASHNQSDKKTEMVAASPAPQSSKENLVEDSGPCAAGMKSRLQRLAEQRKCWDGNSTSDPLPDCAPLSLLKRPAEVQPAAVPSVSTGTPVGRKGRLANLAATIGSWEDDLSHANITKENTEEKPGKAVPKSAVRDATVAASPKPSVAKGYSAASSKSTSSYNQQAVYSPVKPNRPFPPSPQKDDVPAARPVLQSVTSPQKSSNQGMTSMSSPQKSYNHGMAFPSSPQKAGPSSTASVPSSPLKSQVPSRGLNLTASPQKPELRAKPAIVGPSVPQEKTNAGGPVVKSFLERFGERCQERNNPSSPVGGTIQTKTPTVTPSVTPNTRLVQERLKAAQAANTTTADLTQKQRMERESELAKIRSRFQKGNNMWKNKDEATETKMNTDIKEQVVTPVESEVAPCEPQDEFTPSISTKTPGAPTTRTPAGPVLAVSPPALTSSPLRIGYTEEKATDETPENEEVVTEIEMNVDQSINSAVINDLFDGVLDQSEDDEDDEEDALNISSMSLLTPLAETVAAVVRSPERKMMTSTPASSFIVKSPESDSKPSKFQRANIRPGSSDSVEAPDEDHKLPYSISAYRSTRVKETERPHMKQVIVRKEDVSHRAEEPRGSAPFSVKQKIKILTNEMNLQQTVIHQASQALNCCTDEEHGKGSQVEAEAERLVLVAMERREALKTELDRLKGGAAGQKKTPAAPESTNMSASRGSITLQELRLPLKADFVCSIANKPDSTKHSFFIMIRAGAENNVATPLASTHRGLSGDTLTFPTKFTISDVSSDFVIDIQVYCLVQKRDVCSDKKKKPSKSKAITPKRLLGITKSVQTPVLASPGGPNAVRTSNFVLVGSHKLTLSSIGKIKFPLEKIKYEGCERELLSDMFHTKVPFLCPLEGHIYLKMQCEVGSKVEERGFLTMFEDVSGFGAWHRRWCVLSGYYISYWTYPDDEKCKNPIGRINLANCTSKRVEPVNREFCARPNTFELITVRPQKEDDKETLVSQCKNTMCVTTNWLSADTKDERNLWMKKLNQIVVDLRMWQPDACYRPL